MLKKLFGVLFVFLFYCGICFSAKLPLRVILDWFINPDHAPLFVAQQQGFFKQEGLQVKFIAPADPSDGIKLVAANKADITVTYEPQWIQNEASGLPLSYLATLVATPLNCLVVRKDSSIYHIQDLKGKRIGYSLAGTDDIMLKVMLKKHGLSLKDVKLINIHYGLTQALLSKQVDAITGAMRNFEPIEMAQALHPARMFYPEENGMPLYDELILVVNSQKRNDPRYQKFVDALQKGVIYLVNHPKLSWQNFAKNHPELDNRLNHDAWFTTLPRFALRPRLFDRIRFEKYKTFLEKQENKSNT